jgi:hypothetical protein
MPHIARLDFFAVVLVQRFLVCLLAWPALDQIAATIAGEKLKKKNNKITACVGKRVRKCCYILPFAVCTRKSFSTLIDDRTVCSFIHLIHCCRARCCVFFVG